VSAVRRAVQSRCLSGLDGSSKTDIRSFSLKTEISFPMPETLTSAVVWCLVLAAAIESFTCLMRFALQLEATRDTCFLRVLTFGLRIHHCYLGLVIVAAGALLADGLVMNWLFIVGTACVLSDFIHHFVVLWLVTGEPEFDLFYP